MKFTIGQIAALIGAEIEGDSEGLIENVGKIEEAKAGDIAFLSNPKYENFLYDTEASAVIVNSSLELKRPVNTTLLRVEDSYTAFTVLLDEYNRLMQMGIKGREEPVFIGEGSTIGESEYLGAFAYIGKNVKIGNNVKIHPQAYIGDNSVIGDNSIIYAGVKIYHGCIIGSYCTLHSGVVIGSDGFGFAPQKDGSYRKIPQIGNVILKDHVEIGANTTIDCATMGSTVIDEGVKIDNLVQIAHNVSIGKHTVIAAQTGIAGSTKVGEHCVFAGQVGLVGHISIANRTTLASKAGISNNIKEEGKIMLGYPAMDIGDYKRSYAVFRKLPALTRQIKELEEKVINLAAAKD
jgi:UDP-3-O-[3-hydroxymyristoyl] glucosamine N-acyltransferase